MLTSGKRQWIVIEYDWKTYLVGECNLVLCGCAWFEDPMTASLTAWDKCPNCFGKGFPPVDIINRKKHMG